MYANCLSIDSSWEKYPLISCIYITKSIQYRSSQVSQQVFYYDPTSVVLNAVDALAFSGLSFDSIHIWKHDALCRFIVSQEH